MGTLRENVAMRQLCFKSSLTTNLQPGNQDLQVYSSSKSFKCNKCCI